MKIALIANPNSIHTRRWIDHLKGFDLEFHLIGEHPLTGAPPEGIHFYDLTAATNLRKYRYLHWGLAARKLVRKIQPDILHAFALNSAGWLAWAANYHPLLVTSIGSDLMLLEKKSWLQRRLTLNALLSSDYVTTYSRALFDRAVKYGVDPQRIQIATPGIDTSIFKPGPIPPERKNRPCRILSLRAMNEVYRPLDIARAFLLILEKLPDASLVVQLYNVNPSTLEAFKKTVAEAGIAGKVEYLPPSSSDLETAARVSSADVAISVAESDGTPMSVLESMACGAPLVLGDIAPIREWAEDEKEALLVPVGKPDAIAAAVIRLMRDEALRRRIGAAASAKVLSKANQASWRENNYRIYKKVLERNLGTL